MKTWEFLLFIIGVVLVAHFAWAGTFTTITGQGYYTWNGQVVSYYNFTPNSTINLIDGVTATDTNGAPTVPLNMQEFHVYICSVNPNQTQCR
jgi:hypothetical protein